MTEAQASTGPGKGKAFFDRGDQVAATDNWDFAIQMYLEGLKREPDNIERGHQKLRETAMKRKASGGKPAGMVEALKYRPTKDDLETLLNAEFLLAKDPGNVAHMLAVLKAAQKLTMPAVMEWIADIAFEAQRLAKKPDKRIVWSLVDAFEQAGALPKALLACDFGVRSFANDPTFGDRAKNLSALNTIDTGKYDQKGSFVESVKNLEEQQKLMKLDHLAQDRAFLEQAIVKARQEYQESPQVAGKIDAVVDALMKIEEDAFEKEAIGILQKAYAESRAYRFKMRQDDLLARQYRRRIKQLVEAGHKDDARKLAAEQLKFEVDVYRQRAENYPTDLGIKYELGVRLLRSEQVDEAIGNLQQAQRDAKRRIQAIIYLGVAFATKGWHQEAVDTFRRGLDAEPSEDRLKELHYLLANSLEALGKPQEALEHYSEVAQMDYNFRDVRTRIEALRRKAAPGGPASA